VSRSIVDDPNVSEPDGWRHCLRLIKRRPLSAERRAEIREAEAAIGRGDLEPAKRIVRQTLSERPDAGDGR